MNTRTLVAALAGLSLVVAACGSDEPATTESATGDPVTTEPQPPRQRPPNPRDTEPAATGAGPERVVSLSPTHTEMMFAIGAGDLLVAVDELLELPAEALDLPNELSGFEPNVEAIAAFEPDLVLIGGDFTGLGDQLAALDIESWDGPAAVDVSATRTTRSNNSVRRPATRRGRRTGVVDADADRRDRRRGSATPASTADLLPRARPRLLLRRLHDLHRRGVLPARTA